MVLTTAVGGPPPSRGTTLPPNLHLDLDKCNKNVSNSNNNKSSRAHTLPSYSASSSSRVEEKNAANHNWHSADRPMVSRNAPASVSILSLPNSDNEALNFENR